MTKQTRIGCPAGMSGLSVEPWGAGEIYAVAADWAQASCPVVVWGDGEWVSDECGRQVADFRHNARAALKANIESAIRMGGDKPDAEEVKSILDDAEDLAEQDVVDMAAMLDGHGEKFTGNNVDDEAQGWLDNDFTPRAADMWCDIGCWDAAIAAQLRDAGLSPDQVRVAAERLIADAGDDAAEEYTDGCPIYSACNGDTNADVLIEAAKVDAE